MPSSSLCKAWPKWRCVGTANCSWPLLKLKDLPVAPHFCFCHHWLVQPSFLFRIITESLISISLRNTELLGATIFPAGWLALHWIPQHRTESNTPPYVSPNTTRRTFRHLLPIFYNCRWSMQGQLGQFDFYGLTCCHRRRIHVVSTTAVVQHVLFTGNRTSSHTHTPLAWKFDCLSKQMVSGQLEKQSRKVVFFVHRIFLFVWLLHQNTIF